LDEKDKVLLLTALDLVPQDMREDLLAFMAKSSEAFSFKKFIEKGGTYEEYKVSRITRSLRKLTFEQIEQKNKKENPIHARRLPCLTPQKKR